jgi:hypothetical protein
VEDDEIVAMITVVEYQMQLDEFAPEKVSSWEQANVDA